MLKSADEAFNKILERLYQNDMINIDADMKVFNSMLKADGYDDEEISKLYTWEELLSVLDDEYLLTSAVPDEPPTEILKEEHNHKIILNYEVEREQEYDDEDGRYEIRYYTYDIQICIKK